MSTTDCPGCSGCWVPARTPDGGLKKQMMWKQGPQQLGLGWLEMLVPKVQSEE